MTGVHIIALIGGVAILAGMFELLRRGQLREKYAVLWLFEGITAAVFAIFPNLIDDIARPLHVADPPNLLLFAANVVLVLVTVHLSWESSRMEDRTRALAEEVGLLRQQIEQGYSLIDDSRGRSLRYRSPGPTDLRRGSVEDHDTGVPSV